MSTNSDTADVRAPSRLATWLELRAPLDWATLLTGAPGLARAPRGDRKPVMLIPGYRADESSMRPLRRYLEFLNYDVYDWARGRNLGDVDAYVQHVGERAREIQREVDGQAVTLIGWSLGGVIARETARLYPKLVREVITMGTPIVGGPKYTAVADRFAKIANIDLDEFEKEVHERNLVGLKQPVTAIYSKTDGVVGWRACIDSYNAHARNIEVNCSHFGLGANSRVWQIIAEALAPKTLEAPANA